MKGGFIAIVFLGLGMLLFCYHIDEVDKAYIDGVKDANRDCSAKREKDRAIYYEDGVVEGKRLEAKNCEAAKRLIYDQAYSEGKAYGQRQASERHEAELRMIQKGFDAQMSTMRVSFAKRLSDSLSIVKMGYQKQINEMHSQKQERINNKPTIANASTSSFDWSRVIFTLCLIFATPFIAALAQRLLYGRRARSW